MAASVSSDAPPADHRRPLGRPRDHRDGDDEDRAGGLARLDGVQEEVEHDLDELGLVGGHGRQGIELHVDGDARVLVGDEVDDAFEVVAVSGLPDTLRGTRLVAGEPGIPDPRSPHLPVLVEDAAGRVLAKKRLPEGVAGMARLSALFAPRALAAPRRRRCRSHRRSGVAGRLCHHLPHH